LRKSPNRISSSGRRGSDRFRLDQRAWSVLRVRRWTALNCNPNCNLLIRGSMCEWLEQFRSVRDLALVVQVSPKSRKVVRARGSQRGSRPQSTSGIIALVLDALV
jgi:hypothetical protein